MLLIQLLFYMFSAVAILSGLMVIISKNTVRSVLFLVLTFFAMAGNWMLLHAEFLSLVLVLVYVGAVMTLFLFVVMMLNLDTVKFKESFVRYLPIGVIAVLLIVGATITIVGPNQFGLTAMPQPIPEAEDFSNTASLGMVLYTNYALPFLISGVLLLTAIVAAICLTHRVALRRKTQTPIDQIEVKAKDRYRLIKMPSEKK